MTKQVSIVRFRRPFILEIKPYGKFSGNMIDVVRAAIEMNSSHYWHNATCKGKVVVDVGAYIGDTARYFLWRGALKVYSFEPSKRLCEAAKENTKGYPGIVVYNAAIGAQSGSAFLGGTSMGLALGSDSGQPVPVTSFRQAIGKILEQEGKIGLLKLDCEGCEWDVLTEENSDLFEKIDAVAVEIHGDDKNHEAILQYLWRNKFRFVDFPPYYFEKSSDA